MFDSFKGDGFEQFKDKFNISNLEIYKSKYWTWSLRPEQVTLGAGIISLNRYAAKLSDVSSEEMADLSVVVKKIEERLAQVFQYSKINYLMLMMVDDQVHYHVIPRYSKKKEFEGIIFEDCGWPGLPVLSEAPTLRGQLLLSICNKIRSP